MASTASYFLLSLPFPRRRAAFRPLLFSCIFIVRAGLTAISFLFNVIITKFAPEGGLERGISGSSDHLTLPRSNTRGFN